MTMDTGKILMGTALLLIMIGLLVHPTGATDSGTISCALHGDASGFTDQGHACCDRFPETPGFADSVQGSTLSSR